MFISYLFFIEQDLRKYVLNFGNIYKSLSCLLEMEKVGGKRILIGVLFVGLLLLSLGFIAAPQEAMGAEPGAATAGTPQQGVLKTL